MQGQMLGPMKGILQRVVQSWRLLEGLKCPIAVGYGFDLVKSPQRISAREWLLLKPCLKKRFYRLCPAVRM